MHNFHLKDSTDSDLSQAENLSSLTLTLLQHTPYQMHSYTQQQSKKKKRHLGDPSDIFVDSFPRVLVHILNEEGTQKRIIGHHTLLDQETQHRHANARNEHTN